MSTTITWVHRYTGTWVHGYIGRGGKGHMSTSIARVHNRGTRRVLHGYGYMSIGVHRYTGTSAVLITVYYIRI